MGVSINLKLNTVFFEPVSIVDSSCKRANIRLPGIAKAYDLPWITEVFIKISIIIAYTRFIFIAFIF